jgi:uncharacterized membrane protein
MSALLFQVVLPVAALVIAIMAYRLARRAPPAPAAEDRIAVLEEQVRGLLYRVWTLERGAATGEAPAGEPAPSRAEAWAQPAARTEAEAPARAETAAPDVPPLVGATDVGLPAEAPRAGGPEERATLLALGAGAAPAIEAAGPPSRAAGPAEAAPPIDLEQRIGARWATWVGIVAILFAASFFLKWSFENELLGPRARVALGLLAGVGFLAGGLGLHRGRDVPYLSEGLAGLGLGLLYLSLWAAQALYALAGPTATLAAMVGVTLCGAVVAIASSRQITAVFTVLGGLLTPVLLRVERPDEGNLLVYLIVLDFLVLAIARFRSWPLLNRLAWAGTALLYIPVFLRAPEAPNPLTRLVLVSGLFLLFLAVPLLRERAEHRRIGEVDLLLVIGNAAGYFWVVQATLEAWHPGAQAPWALALALVYRGAAADYAARVPGDRATVVLHEGIAWVFLTIAIPLALDGPWVTLAWAVEGVMLLWLARHLFTPVATWGALAALALASLRVAALDRYWYPESPPVWNLTYLVHLLVVAALAAAGVMARGIRDERLGGATGAHVGTALWVAAPAVLAVLLWREPPGFWPATLLTAELLVLAALARLSASLAFVLATPLLAAVLLARVLGADDALARASAASLVSRSLASRIAACAALGVAGGWLARSEAARRAPIVGRLVSGAGGLALLVVLSVDWTRYQDLVVDAARAAGRRQAAAEVRWRTQVGLSVLWSLYAAAAVAWGFVRSAPAVRYAALGLFGLTVFKVFLVDLSAVRTAYRILSFLILGVVLLLVSLLYQRARRPAAAGSPDS